jgi:two-component system, sensor histidine kinase PdtaS
LVTPCGHRPADQSGPESQKPLLRRLVWHPGPVATLAELTHQHTSLTKAQTKHLQLLVSEWGLLADLRLVLGHVRPVTSQTIYPQDWVATFATEDEDAVLAATLRDGRITEGSAKVDESGDTVRLVGIPVRYEGDVIAVCTREWTPTGGRQPGELERAYLDLFRRFSAMVAAGVFPFSESRRTSDSTPRVGDGAIVLDASARVTFASPNAVSALHRVGISANAIGLRLSELGFNDTPLRTAFDERIPVIDEFEQTTNVTLLVRCIPIIEQGELTGGVLLLRDVSELRRRDRLLLSKDATIREIHHRVKNNLQTISSLLRLQGRRLTSPEAKEAIEESVRRIRTIALVHETLSRDAGDDVQFIEIVRPLARMAEESLQSPDRPIRFSVRGDGGMLSATMATPLSVVLTELLQNAVDHAFDTGDHPGQVVVLLDSDDEHLKVRVIDNGRGLPEGFSLDAQTGLGLSIVRTLVTTELAGEIEMRVATAADLAEVGLDATMGTAVELTVPIRIE